SEVAELFPSWAERAAHPGFVFVGGPVHTDDALVALGRVVAPGAPDASGAWQPLFGAVGSIDLGVPPDDVVPCVESFRAFAGYAGWGPGQLDDELDLGGWHVVDAEPGDLLTDAPDTLWRRVLRRQGGELAMAANQPPDPTVN
ncbi:MAG: YqgE/AlgH family protein, partial [Acidimicrobiia bacterium]